MFARLSITSFARRMFIGVAVSTSLISCVDVEGPVPQPLTPSEVLADLKMSTFGAVMQLGDSLDLEATAFAMDGSEIPINDRRELSWFSSDRVRVRVDSMGRIYAQSASSEPVYIGVKWTLKGITEADSIPVTVTDTRYDLTSIKLVPLDSLRVGNGFTSPNIRIDGYAGNDIAVEGAILPLFASAPVTITRLSGANYFTVSNLKSHIGKFVVRVGGNVYGKEMSDSIEMTGIYPANSGTNINMMAWEANPNPDAGWVIEDHIGYFQPCAAFLLGAVTTHRPIEVVFSDSATSTQHDCELTDTAIVNNLGLPFGKEVSGGNLEIPANTFGIFIRKSRTLGEVSWFARYADTKEIIPVFKGRYLVIEPEE